MIEHHIQREILDRLMRARVLTFSQLKPAGMENSSFMYHLRRLIAQGYVCRSDSGYTLAAKGLTYVDGLSATSRKPRQQPKLIVILALQDDAGRWLLAERKIQPYIGTLMFLSGKRHWGEGALEHAERELHEKAGLQNVSLRRRGLVEIKINSADGILITHAVAIVYCGTVPGGVLPPDTDRLRYVWHSFNDAGVACMPGTREVYEWLADPEAADLTLSVQQP